MLRQKQGQAEWKPLGRATVTAAIRGPVSSSATPQMTTSMRTPPPTSSSMVVTTLSSTITSMAMAVQAEHPLSTVSLRWEPAN